jgi:hypothetical protein
MKAIAIQEVEEEEDSFNAASVKVMTAAVTAKPPPVRQDTTKSPRKSMLSLASDAVATRVSALSVRHKKMPISPTSPQLSAIDEFPGSKTTRSITLQQLESDLNMAA